jgi:hypothetical protein
VDAADVLPAASSLSAPTTLSAGSAPSDPSFLQRQQSPPPQQQRQVLCQEGPAVDLAAGTPLCFSFQPHSFSVCKTRKGRATTPSAVDTFNDDRFFLKCLHSTIEVRGDVSCSPLVLSSELRFVQGSWIQNFQPLVAAALYRRFGGTGGTVYDSSAGWGGRMLGAWAAGVARYIACEPSTLTFRGLQEMARLLRAYDESGCSPPDTPTAAAAAAAAAAGVLATRPRLVVELHAEGSEDFRPAPCSVHMALTSPPYFNLELYADEPTQSHVRFPDPHLWRDGFLRPTVEHTFAALVPGGVMCINVSNSEVLSHLQCDLVAWTHAEAEKVGAQLVEAVPMLKGAPVEAWDSAAELEALAAGSKEVVLVFRKPHVPQAAQAVVLVVDYGGVPHVLAAECGH